MANVIKADKFVAQNVQYSDTIRTNKYQGKSVYAYYENRPLRLQLPKLSLPFGVSKWASPDKPEDVKYHLDLSLGTPTSELISKFEEIEQRAIEYAEKNSKELFKKQLSKEMLGEFFKSSIKFSEDENGERSTKYAPRLKVKVYNNDDRFSADFWESEKVNGKYQKMVVNEENVDDVLAKGTKLELIIKCVGIWVVGKTFGVSWVLEQAKVYPNENTLNGYAFEDDAEDDAEGEEEAEVEYEEAEVEYEEVEEEKPRQRRKRESFE